MKRAVLYELQDFDGSFASFVHRNTSYYPDWQAHKPKIEEEREYKEYPSRPFAKLNDQGSEQSDFQDLLKDRRSVREFTGRALSKHDVAKLILSVYGVTRTIQQRRKEVPFHSVPSAGALYPLELYLIVRKVNDLDQGIYHYNARCGTLEALDCGALDLLHSSVFEQECVLHAAAIIVISAVFARTIEKYGARGYRFALMEAGIAAEHVVLQSADLGIATLMVGGFWDDMLNFLLGLDDEKESALLVVACGYSEKSKKSVAGAQNPHSE
jgi:SagB-type dehydrogenase family enzyme